MAFAFVVMSGRRQVALVGASTPRAAVTRTPGAGHRILTLFGKTNPVIAAFSPSPTGRAGIVLEPASHTQLPVMPSSPVTPWAINVVFQCLLSLILLWSATRAVAQPFAEQHWIELRRKPQLAPKQDATDDATLSDEPTPTSAKSTCR